MFNIPSVLDNIVNQFNTESQRQGSVFNPLVQDRIKIADIHKIQELSFTVFGASNLVDALKRLPSGDVCIYGKTDGDKYARPIEYTYSVDMTIDTIVEEKIKIGDVIFYDRFERIINSCDGVTIKPSQNLSLNLTIGRIDFNVVTTIDGLYRDSLFLQALRNGVTCQIGDQILQLVDLRFTPEFLEQLEFFILANLYSYDFETFQKQIDESDVTSSSAPVLLHVALSLINIYDMTANMHFLDLANNMLSRVKHYVSEVIFLLNDLQIKKRRIGLDESDCEKLHHIESDDIEILFGKNVLLDNKELSMYYYHQFSADKMKLYQQYPIYTLFRKTEAAIPAASCIYTPSVCLLRIPSPAL